jgi:hypothetical protein
MSLKSGCLEERAQWRSMFVYNADSLAETLADRNSKEA